MLTPFEAQLAMFARPTRAGLVALLLGGSALITGCERKEKIVDIETPRGEVEVERNIDTGQTEVEVHRD